MLVSLFLSYIQVTKELITDLYLFDFLLFRIIRGSDYIFRSEEQQHSFNFPVQAGTNSKDTPIKDAQRFIVKVQKDDVSNNTIHSLRLIRN